MIDPEKIIAELDVESAKESPQPEDLQTSKNFNEQQAIASIPQGEEGSRPEFERVDRFVEQTE
jgi:hypothetical protein